MTHYRFDPAEAHAMMQAGRHGDTILAHINPHEAAMLKAMGGSGTRNPRTGLLEFFDTDAGGQGSGSVSDSPGASNEGAGQGLGGSSNAGDIGVQDTAFGQGLMGQSQAAIESVGKTAQEAQAAYDAGFGYSPQESAFAAAGYGPARGYDTTAAGKLAGSLGTAVAGPQIGTAIQALADYASGKPATGQNLSLDALNIATGGLVSTGQAIGQGLQGLAGILGLDPNPMPGPMGPTSQSEPTPMFNNRLFDLAATHALLTATPVVHEANSLAMGGQVRPAAPTPHIGNLMGGAVRGPGGPTDDRVAADVPVGSVVIPAHVVASLGGHDALDRGIPGPVHAHPDTPLARCDLSNGEYVVAPHRVAALGRGQHHEGMRALVAMAAQGGDMGQAKASGGYVFDLAACSQMLQQHMAGGGAVLPPRDPYLDNPIGTEQVGRQSLTMPTPGVDLANVRPMIRTAPGQLVTQADYDRQQMWADRAIAAAPITAPGAWALTAKSGKVPLGDTTAVIAPSKPDIARMLNESPTMKGENGEDFKAVRALLEDGRFVAWPANDAVHADVAKAMGFSPRAQHLQLRARQGQPDSYFNTPFGAYSGAWSQTN